MSYVCTQQNKDEMRYAYKCACKAHGMVPGLCCGSISCCDVATTSVHGLPSILLSVTHILFVKVQAEF